MLLEPGRWYPIAESVEDVRCLLRELATGRCDRLEIHIETLLGVQTLHITPVSVYAGNGLTHIIGTEGPLRIAVQLILLSEELRLASTAGNVLLCG